ncbi:uncharacterized protein LOC123663626 [Melitaea cinxia]|uniref:uncharacterized protein LOC123663626 n=1 Tax=Melitaea cinxia TaxID=113334 RepID=UPI001E26FE58|nr:uncharacterized protein LOC123663626 [Melitaea cinxia]
MVGTIALLSVPTTINVLVGSRRANSKYTAYKRYVSTFFHFLCWLQNDIKPGSVSWKSLQTVRRRHLQSDRAAKLKGQGTISQRDVSLTLFCLSVGFPILKPDKFSIYQLEDGDWEGYIHFWGVISYMLGLQDRYNICRGTFEETRQICQRIRDRVYTPCLENVPEYFEHSVHVILEGTGTIVPGLEVQAMLYLTKNIAEVPGYIYTESERIQLQSKLRKHLKGKSPDTGVESTALMKKSAIDGLPKALPNILYLHDYDTVENSPAYKILPFIAKYRLAVLRITLTLYSTNIGRLLLNLYSRWLLFIAQNFPYVAMWRFGFKNAFIDMFREDPTDDTIPRPNAEFYKPRPPEPWYKCLFDILW